MITSTMSLEYKLSSIRPLSIKNFDSCYNLNLETFWFIVSFIRTLQQQGKP